jgi:hypothetical protein
MIFYVPKNLTAILKLVSSGLVSFYPEIGRFVRKII